MSEDVRPRKQRAEKQKKAKKDAENAISNYNGNPETENGLKALNKRIDAIAEELNLDI